MCYNSNRKDKPSMKKIEKVKDSFHNFIWWTGIVGKVVMFQVSVVLMVLGILYITNFRISIQPIIHTVSPIIEEAHE